MKKSQFIALSMFISTFCFAQEKFWTFESEQFVSTLKRNIPQSIIPKVYRTLSLPFKEYKTFLNTAPAEALVKVSKGLVIALPYPDNSFKKFRIVETKMMEDGLVEQFPQIKTYTGQGIDDPAATVRIDYTSLGFHAYVRSPAGSLFIDPYQKGGNSVYLTYLSKDYINPEKEKITCKLHNQAHRNADASLVTSPLTGTCIGSELRTYRAAISCTGEYAKAVCPPGNITVANTLSAIVTTLNRVNGVYQTELDIKMILVAREAAIIYTDSTTDPYSGNKDVSQLLDEGESNITSVIGSSNFDIGHTFGTGEGGLATLESVCSNGSKAGGATGLPAPSGDAYDIDFVAHEMGHQFGATHTFESETGNCGGGNRLQSTAFEPGSGTTIMAYAGICGADNIQSHTDPYFHTKSFDQIVSYTTTGTGAGCAVVSATGNYSPVIIMPASGLTIPKGTPFTLTGTATDIDGDALTYSWEEWDISNSGSGSAWNSGASSTVTPLFKVRNPTISGSRTFPDISVILAKYPSNPDTTMDGLKGETLPQVARQMKFRVVARDNKASGGGVATGGNGCSSTAAFTVFVSPDGPFRVTAPNTPVNWLGGSTHTVTWDVANTNAAGINAQNVDILMSTDGGKTYPTTIILNTPNVGSKSVVIPNIPTSNLVRFMVRSSGNIFFDISDENLTITFISVLPDSLLLFSASPEANAILLNWSSIADFNAQRFIILRSEGNDSSFSQIGFLPATGNGGTIQSYTFTDTAVKKGVVYYYRLQQVDLNNLFFYSTIKRAKIGLGGTFSASVQPQPFYTTTDLYLSELEKKDLDIIVIDAIGRTVLKKAIKNTESSRLIPLNFNNLASGIYFIKIFQNNVTATIKTVKI